MKLIDLKEGDKATIKKINLEKKVKLKLISLGLNENIPIEIKKNDNKGSIIIAIKENRIIIARDVAEKIDVQRKQED